MIATHDDACLYYQVTPSIVPMSDSAPGSPLSTKGSSSPRADQAPRRRRWTPSTAFAAEGQRPVLTDVRVPSDVNMLLHGMPSTAPPPQPPLASLPESAGWMLEPTIALFCIRALLSTACCVTMHCLLLDCLLCDCLLCDCLPVRGVDVDPTTRPPQVHCRQVAVSQDPSLQPAPSRPLCPPPPQPPTLPPSPLPCPARTPPAAPTQAARGTRATTFFHAWSKPKAWTILTPCSTAW